MKQKSHSGLKKRLRIRKSGTVMVQKSAKNHLLSNKSKRQKKAFRSGMHVNFTKMQIVRRLIPGAASIERPVKKAKNVVKAEVKK